MTLTEAYEQLRSRLAPLGVEIGPEVLAVWRDRVRDGREPLPDVALRDLATWVTSLRPHETVTTRATIGNDPVTRRAGCVP